MCINPHFRFGCFQRTQSFIFNLGVLYVYKPAFLFWVFSTCRNHHFRFVCAFLVHKTSFSIWVLYTCINRLFCFGCFLRIETFIFDLGVLYVYKQPFLFSVFFRIETIIFDLGFLYVYKPPFLFWVFYTLSGVRHFVIRGQTSVCGPNYSIPTYIQRI
jgi:hypothetical protein